ncbi:head maturation protease, ClpP-related [Pediococcus pentosaceus]|jgi:ATP-dependent Clp protease protease subunit|uniref:head maturation protease, ClpP-related n=1 Tax=Pediococcus pentosaceus TaxID=1255 RepID=UPI0011B4AA05|nr:head maturation protease, ClpP-related [Pediococcus pentosaceus]QDZ69510.1 Clp protease ClpP [Pediococcus pentosaceus]
MTVKINVKGPIISNDDKWIYDMFGMTATAPNDVIDALPADGSDVEVDVNSNGGLVDSGSEIYTALKSYSGKVTVNVVGMAASAASLIAMAGNPTRISPVGQIMIHNVSAGIYGDYRDQAKLADVLKQSSEAIANAYQLKTGLSMDNLLAKMDEETYLNADKAKELGFVDEIMFDEEPELDLVADNGSGLLPRTAIEKVKELMDSKTNGTPIAKTIKPRELSGNEIMQIADAVVEQLNRKPERTEDTFNPFAF